MKKLKNYLKKNKIKRKDFAQKLGISTVTLNYYLRMPERVKMDTKLAIEFLTGGEIRREEW